MPKSVRTLPPVPRADETGQLEELSADDILESDDIDALEAAAAGYSSFEAEAAAPYVAPQPVAAAAPAAAPAPAPAPEPSGFEVGDVGAFDEVEVEGIATRATQPAAQPASIGAVAVLAPVVKVLETTKPIPSTLMGMPAAPVTSPLPLEDKDEESVIVSEPAPVTARTPVTVQSAAQPAAQPAPPHVVEKTLEIRGNDMAKVAAAAAKLGSEPDQTEVLVRSAMPAALQNVRGIQNGRPSSVAPVALDVSRPLMPVIPPMARVPSVHVPPRAVRPATGLSGLAIGGMAAAAILLVSLVGIGGYAASRTLSAKTDAVEATPSEAAGEATTTAAGGSAPNEAPSPGTGEPQGAASSPIDVSSLPSAPVPGAAPRGFTGKGSFAVTPPPLPVAVVAAPAVAAPAAAPAAPAAAPAAPVARSGGALAAPGAGRSAPAGAPLPPPPSAPAAAAAPVAAAPASTTGVVRVDPNLRAVVVDGSFRHASDGAVTVSCGTHRIKAGMKETQTVNVPCGGAVSL